MDYRLDVSTDRIQEIDGRNGEFVEGEDNHIVIEGVDFLFGQFTISGCRFQITDNCLLKFSCGLYSCIR